MALKYKLKEAPSPNLANQVGAKIGDVSYSKDGDTKFVVNSIDKETGQIGWKVIELPAFDKLNDDVDELVSTAKGVYTKTKSDEEFRKIYEEARLLRNKIRKHLRNEYPDEYKRMTMEGEIEEMSTTGGGAGSASFTSGTGMQYATPYAFKLPKKQKKIVPEGNEEAITYFQQAIKLSHTNKVRNLILKAAKELGLEIPKVWTETVNENNKNPGATLGPGPKATEDGVKDNYIVKAFKYTLVPKNKKGTYVQKGSGLEVNKLF